MKVNQIRRVSIADTLRCVADTIEDSENMSASEIKAEVISDYNNREDACYDCDGYSKCIKFLELTGKIEESNE